MAGGRGRRAEHIKEPFVSKNVAVFVDVANIFYAAKAAGTDIDYVTLLKAAVAGRDFVRAYAYTGLDPENENQRNFHSFLARHGYKVVSKDIRKYGDGKVKANLDIELVVDMMKTARNLDVAVVVSGDGDFAPAIRAVQEMGVRVEVISFRGNTSSDLIEAADAFYDITQLAKVDRDSTRSGRRVAGDEEDLSMTEVPDKQTEGRGGRRGRGTRRGRAVADEAGAARSGGKLVALPGEKLSRAAGGEAGDESGEEVAEEGQEAVEGAEAGRRRRRRGGRGRGHGGRGREESGRSDEEGEEGEEEAVSAAPANRPNQFGSVWDSQIGMAGRPERLAPVGPVDEDDYAEPEIPEYLLAERKRGGRGRGGRGSRSAYASAVERERFGRSSSLRYPEPARQPQPQRRREERPQRQQQPQQHRGGGQQRGGGRESAEPWSEVPPELEELLRAQLSSKLTRQPEEPAEAPSNGEAVGVMTEAPAAAAPKRRAPARKKAEAAEAAQGGEAGETAAEAKPARGRRKAAAAESGAAAESAPAEAAPKRRAPARRKAAAPADGEAAGEAPVEAPAEPVGE
jgi:uncharacterized LabA/DUF88 family protein